MELTKENILNKTNYGLKIFAKILRSYYPTEVVLSVSGRECKPSKNPFNKNKQTLVIEVLNDCAVFKDLEDAIPNGDVFDFAELHYKKHKDALLKCITDDLGITTPRRVTNIDYDHWYDDPIIPRKQEVLVPSFSYYKKPISNIKPYMKTDLYNIWQCIRNINYRDETIALRKIKDPKQARKFKAYNFNYVTFSGVFSKRNDKNLLKHSGLVTIDFDHVQDTDELKFKLIHDNYFETELIFISPSGDGLKWVIPIDILAHSHQIYFKAISNYIRQTYNVEIDKSGKDVSRACFLPNDKDAYINPKYIINHEYNKL